MNDSESFPRLILPEGFDEQAKGETPLRGYLSHTFVAMENGFKYSVYFVDPGRLQQDLLEYVKLGTPYFAEPGLVVLPEVTIETITNAIRQLGKEGFFDQLKPIAMTDE